MVRGSRRSTVLVSQMVSASGRWSSVVKEDVDSKPAPEELAVSSPADAGSELVGASRTGLKVFLAVAIGSFILSGQLRMLAELLLPRRGTVAQ
jgi:hypothetical protein